MEDLFKDFGSKVFGEKEMKSRLPRPVYLSWKKTVANEEMLDRTTADAIAHAMKLWALDNGATHFTHWFQPMTGGTAEKHDSFLEPDINGEPFARFSGKMLIKGEPDASSFPNGGLRTTFEARGYTYWDVKSPVFIRDNILCIPTVFVSYSGEALDKKDPLLKSLEALSQAATRVVNILGDKDVKSCDISVGLEQEYFLIDRKYFDRRLDLRFTGRTLFGVPSPKTQELDDHYFGAIPPRVAAFMKEANQELWKLGIYAKTEHNEVAPGQFELAPIFTNGNVAVDQNHLIMDILRETAKKHGFACLLHEKPFQGINGSGKHDNYSIITDDGQNLFSPGEKPAENIRFLLFVCAFIRAVDTYPLLLRLSASCTGNDHRLGANEAPPAIISIYLGSYIENILYDIYTKNSKKPITQEEKTTFNPVTGLSYIPHDNTDRNRTSPLAFTGNKFEFRMLGSSMSASFSNTVLNAIMAESLNQIADELEGIKYIQDIREKALTICRNLIEKHKRILFSGDGYSEEWAKEAKRRGLPNVKSFIESTEVLNDPSVINLFTSLNIYSEKELAANRIILQEQYEKIMGIEVRTMIEMARKDILPSQIAELKFYNDTINSSGKNTPKFIRDHARTISTLIDQTYQAIQSLEDAWQKVTTIGNTFEVGQNIYYKINPLMDKLRASVDAYEKIAAREFYKLPSYEDILFNI
ncbi:MAG: glutamine synthetase III [Solobacterium sp.]|uniref:glutamine synthetase III family protein n=1 Tax=Solobacterium sp. TaxID=2060878 RepID=UPI001CABA326|nr:glutamine synthetase III [Solobacterium sp.]MBF1089641.1 glutamine synthetase III [Solobacterium sp.]MBF1103115.1 glutamine synthetase III [Solobacterium sp.]